MANEIQGKKVAILAADGFEESELRKPKEALEAAGAQTVIVSLQPGSIRGWKDKNWSDQVLVDHTVDDAKAENFDALVIPGGTMNPDKLRMDEKAVAFVRRFFESGKTIGSICHGPWVLVEADLVRGRRVTSYKAIKTDLINAGARWEDSEVVVDEGIVTSRQPDDLPAFCDKLIEEIAEGKHERAPMPSGRESRATMK
jgi:protease I